jgi:hypothetical protein
MYGTEQIVFSPLGILLNGNEHSKNLAPSGGLVVTCERVRRDVRDSCFLREIEYACPVVVPTRQFPAYARLSLVALAAVLVVVLLGGAL